MGDEYERRARIYPVLLAALPISTLAVVVGITEAEWWTTLTGLAIASGFWMLTSQVGRHLGKRREPELWMSWGGAPTTILLRHSANQNPVRLARLHTQLSSLTALTIPTAESEQGDPAMADATYEAATDALRNATRDASEYPLVFKENCNYGFRRNMWGIRRWGIGASVMAAALTAVLVLVDTNSRWAVGGDIGVPLIALDLAGALAWWQLVRGDWVKQPAFAYAQRLLEAAESLTRRHQPRAHFLL